MALQRPGQSYNNNEYFLAKQQHNRKQKGRRRYLLFLNVLIPAEVNLQGRPAPPHLLRPDGGRGRGRDVPQQDLHLQPEARRPEL